MIKNPHKKRLSKTWRRYPDIKDAISDRQLQWLKKRTGAAVTLSELKRLKKIMPNK